MTNLHFNLRYHTEFGQTLWITGNTEELGNDNTALALPMTYLNDQSWQASITFRRKDWPGEGVNYRYFLRNRENEIIAEWGRDRIVQVPGKEITDVYLHDTWNHAGEYENAFFTAPFNNVLLKPNHPSSKKHGAKHYTHIFRVKAPLLAKHEVVTLAGSDPAMGNWAETDNITLFKEADWWTAYLDLSHANFPLSYKYGVFHQKEERFIKFEDGDNRTIPDARVKECMTVVHDGFIHLPNNTWKGAGVSIPVFSLRTKSGFGVGEFTDLKWLVDWANETNLKLIQILPVNDTIATHTWVDSYPYAAISAFALHPLYINLETCAGKKHADILGSLKKKHKQLNQLEDVDYEEVTRFKLEMLKELYGLRQDDLDSGDYKEFFSSNKHWLVPYAAFCYFRDLYGTTHFKEWDSNSVYDKAQIDALLSGDSPFKKEINFYCFVQYHLHLQLKSAADYAHKHGVVLKGDIPIGIYRYGCDAWVNPSLYNMDEQAGAPPDDFTAIGQNWDKGVMIAPAAASMLCTK